jgi:outer membrane protein assembly factor BamB
MMSATQKQKRTNRAFLLSTLSLMVLVTGCASVRERAGNIFNRGTDPKVAVKADAERVSVLGLEEVLRKDPALEAVVVTVPDAVEFADWATTGGSLTNAPQNVAGAGPLNVVMRRKVGAGAQGRRAVTAPPIIVGGKIYVLDARNTVYALDQATLRQVWRKDLTSTATARNRFFGRESADALGGGLSSSNGKIYAATGFGNLVALDGATGTEVWRMNANSPIHASPLAGGGRVFVTTNDSELFAVDAATGEVQWTQSAIAEPARMLSSPSPALVGETLVAPFASGEVIAMLSANGRRLWSEALTRAGTTTSLSTINDIAGRPAVSGGLVFASSQSGTFAAVEMRTGVRVWDKPIASVQSPWVAGNYVYVVSTGGELVALDTKTGGVKWTRQLPAYKNERKKKDLITWTGPVMVGGRLVLASSDGRLEIVSPQDGTTISTRNIRSEIYVSPAISNGTIYYYTNDGEVLAVR